MSTPLVSIICLCHNQAAFVQEAIESVWRQTYPNIELVVVDDGSTDESVIQIQNLLQQRPEVRFLEIKSSIGNCKAFNRALPECRGEFVIDLAADDVLLPERVATGVETFERAGAAFGVHFSDAIYIDADGRKLRAHYKRSKKGKLLETVPQGWVYADLVQRYFICTPTMMMRRAVLDSLKGYDESLAYEDFDFWIRSSRRWKYCYSDEVLVKKRIVPGSWSTQQYHRKSKQLETTLLVCQKVKQLNKTKEENKALGRRLAYEIRQAVRSGNADLALEMLKLKREVKPVLLEDMLYYLWSRINLSFIF